jgi:hypothetical protein
MFSKKAKVVMSTLVLTVLGVAVTGVASARVGRVAEVRSSVAAALQPVDDNGGADTGTDTKADDSSDVDRHDHGPRGRMRAHLEAASAALGMTPEDVRTALQGGSTLADLAKAKNVALQKVVDAIVVDEKAEVAQAVADGKLTQTQADALLAKVVEHVTAIVNGEHPVPPMGRGRHGDDHGYDGIHKFGHHDETNEDLDA